MWIGKNYWEELTGHHLLLKYSLEVWLPKYLDALPPSPPRIERKKGCNFITIWGVTNRERGKKKKKLLLELINCLPATQTILPPLVGELKENISFLTVMSINIVVPSLVSCCLKGPQESIFTNISLYFSHLVL